MADPSNDHRIQLYSSAEDVDEVVSKAEVLLSQIEQYRKFLVQNRKYKAVDLSTFHNSVIKEHKLLQRVKSTLLSDLTSDSLETKEAYQSLRSSNLGYYLAVWDAAKSCTGLVSFQKRVYWDAPTRDKKKDKKPQKGGVNVDLSAQDGAEWIKVSTVTEGRLVRELAEKGFNANDSSDEDDAGEIDEDDMVELVKTAHDLRKASQSTRVRYKHPQIRFILPKIKPGRLIEVDHILDQICATGAIVNCGLLPEDRATLPLNELFVQLLPSASHTLTETVNVDCTILLALVSDLSHYDTKQILREAEARTPGRMLKSVIIQQMEREVEEQLLQAVLYPLLRGHDLVCTKEAAVRMREVVSTIGTAAEKERTAILMGDLNLTTQEQLREKLSALSTYTAPAQLSLPIKTVQAEISLSRLPHVAEKVVDHFSKTDTSSVTRSVFLYGWQENITTISSNRVVAKAIEGVIHEQDTDDGGPDVYLVSTARSLVGKEKRGTAKGTEGKLADSNRDATTLD